MLNLFILILLNLFKYKGLQGQKMVGLQVALKKLYGNNIQVLQYQTTRYQNLITQFKKKFSLENGYFFSTPGRAEIGGNHTDHNNGCVLAGAVNFDSIAVALPSEDQVITIYSDGYAKPFVVDLKNKKPVEKEKHTTNALIRGIAVRFLELGYNAAGFKAVISSDVFPGSGLSSSASIEVLIATIFNTLFNQGIISPDKLAIIGQYAENVFFGKPCGLMDQTACAFGGIISIDFEKPNAPVIEQINFDLEKYNYALVVVNTGGDHADLTEDYAAIPREMKAVAKVLGKKIARELTRQEIIENIKEIRKRASDRAVLRALHFVEENKRALQQIEELKNKNFNAFLKLINDSGISSYCYLQNVFSIQRIKDQSVALGLELSSNFINRIGEGACRIHGGGFAGTILAFLPKSKIKDYTMLMESVFGHQSVTILNFRFYGSVCLSDV
jgi:galactokinase